MDYVMTYFCILLSQLLLLTIIQTSKMQISRFTFILLACVDSKTYETRSALYLQNSCSAMMCFWNHFTKWYWQIPLWTKTSNSTILLPSDVKPLLVFSLCTSFFRLCTLSWLCLSTIFFFLVVNCPLRFRNSLLYWSLFESMFDVLICHTKPTSLVK